MIVSLSSLSASFPTEEVEYSDLLGVPFRRDGRTGDGYYDCLGVVLEVFRRAGLGLPDPKLQGGRAAEFSTLFEETTDPNQLYDLADVRRGTDHLYIQVRPGILLSCRDTIGVHTQRLNTIRRLAEVKFWRLRNAVLP